MTSDSGTVDVCHIQRAYGGRRFCCGLPVEEQLHPVHPSDITVTPCVSCGRPKCPLCVEVYSPARAS